MESNKSFILKLLYLTALTEALSGAWYFFMPEKYVTPTLFVLPLFFLGLTLVIHSFLSKTNGQRFQNFLNRFMIVTTIKLLGLLAVMTLYVLRFPEDAIVFVITLFVNYLIFTLYEARALIIHGKSNAQ
jgi:uncharacterized membrane protein